MKLDEVSKQTLASYIPKAATSAAELTSRAANKLATHDSEEHKGWRNRSGYDKDDEGTADEQKAVRRLKNVEKATKKLANESLLAALISEVKNHMGENVYHSYSSWRSACKKANPSVQFEGDKEICNAKPGVGEWDGVTGVVYKKTTESIDLPGEEYDDMPEEVDSDTITMDIPFLIRMFEIVREEIKSDEDLHKFVERLLAMKDRGVLTMDDYDDVMPTAPYDEPSEDESY